MKETVNIVIDSECRKEFLDLASQISGALSAGRKVMVIPVTSESDRRYMEKSRKFEDKMNFVRNVGAVLSMAREHITGCELITDGTVVVTWSNGYTKEVNINCDSDIAIMKDILCQIEL